jgi:ribulose-phosphate 3-epimerase
MMGYAAIFVSAVSQNDLKAVSIPFSVHSLPFFTVYMHVIPALLTNNVEDLFQQVDKLIPYYTKFQIDIADGDFVPNTTVQITDIGSYLNHTSKRYDSPIRFDFHLMVTDWESEIELLTQLDNFLTIDTVFIHYGVLKTCQAFPRKQSKYTIGLVANPEDDIEEIDCRFSISTIPSIQLMTVSPGFQGSPFVPESLQKIDYLQRKHYEGPIYIDGSVNDKTLPVINTRKHKPDYIGVGSFLSKAENIEERVAFLKQYE